jgi:hypothetical protein
VKNFQSLHKDLRRYRGRDSIVAALLQRGGARSQCDDRTGAVKPHRQLVRLQRGRFFQIENAADRAVPKVSFS